MKIGVWGSYDKGNFGDDLMAYMIVKFLKEKGNELYLFNATKPLSTECDTASIQEIKDFVNEVDLVVIGGGGMLINNSIIRFLAKRVAFEFELSFYHLYTALQKSKKPLIPISMGGSGNFYLNNPYKNRLFNKPVCVGGTVRLPSDLNSVDSDLFQYIPDIVLSTKHFFNSTNSNGSKRIILNLKKKTGKTLLHRLFNSEIKDQFEIFTFGSHLAQYQHLGNYELLGGPNHFQFENLHDTVDFLAGSSAVVSSKLHIGVTGLAVGTPFISFHGPGKAKEFLKTSSLSNYISDDIDQVENQIKSLEDYPLDSLNGLMDQSYRHFSFLEEKIN